MRERSEWVNGIILCPPVILRTQLRPFSLIHHLLLDHAESPYLCGGDVEPEHFALAVYICSMNFREIERPSDSWFKRWRRYRIHAAMLRNWDEDEAAFSDYISAYQQMPEHWTPEKPEASKEVGAPIEYHIHRRLCIDRGMTEAEAWDCPVGRARCYFDAWAEAECNDDSIVSEQDIRDIKLAQT